ncbi:MAG: GTPase ObgE [Gammaproteobacteria bacterium]|nr:GTPase ObgE [Gammaproteobacteria bacterium]
MFIDETKIKIESGRGGDGAVCFRHEKYLEKGGPSGGDGGDGGSIIFVADKNVNTLLNLRYKRLIKAQNGENGKIKNMTGKKGEDEVINVPLGTMIFNEDTNELVADLTKDGERRVILEGGKGGLGNQHFATSRNQAPTYAEPGGMEKKMFIRLELKVLADVGFVGYPSVGKSTLISVISEAKPKIAAYHFTTLQPNLGMVETKDGRTFVCADLPGLIEGASKGLGLGFEFLRHVERTRLILHILDGSKEEGDLFKDYETIREELNSYDPSILNKKELIVINKSDSEFEKINEELFIHEYKEKYNKEPEIIVISALQKDNLNELLYKIADSLDEIKDEEPQVELKDDEKYVEYNFEVKKDKGYEVTKDWDRMVYSVQGPRIDELMRYYNENSDEAIMRVTRNLKKMGVEEELKKIGCKDGDIVRIGTIEFEFNE